MKKSLYPLFPTKIIIHLCLLLMLASCGDITYVFVDVVTPTPIYPPTITPSLAPTSSPIPLISTATPTLFSQPTSTNIPPIKIVDHQIINQLCQNGKVKSVTVQLIITGGQEPYDYPNKISLDGNGDTTISVNSKDGQIATYNIHVAPNCPVRPLKEICNNGKDDDGDGAVDSADPDCPPSLEICNNGVDDDGDGKIDSADPDCPPPPEICGNGVDDDRDGKIDSADPDCPPEPPFNGQCKDGKDNDADGLIDTDDPQCHNKNDDNESR